MLRLIRDYWRANQKRARTDLLTVYAGTLLLGYGLFWPIRQDISLELLKYALLYATGALVAVALVLFLLHLLTAYSVVFLLARARGLSINDYIGSDHYVREGMPKLKQPEARKFW